MQHPQAWAHDPPTDRTHPGRTHTPHPSHPTCGSAQAAATNPLAARTHPPPHLRLPPGLQVVLLQLGRGPLETQEEDATAERGVAVPVGGMSVGTARTSAG